MESWSSLIDSLLSFASYNESIFRLQTFREYWLHFGSSPGWSYFFLPSRGSCLLAWIQTRIWGNSGFGFPCAQACFLGWDFLTTNISPHWRLIIHPTFCPTYSYMKELICCLVYRPGPYKDWKGYINRTIDSEFSSKFVYINGTIPILSYWAHTGYILARGLYKDWRCNNMNSVRSNSLCLKVQSIKPSGCKDKGITEF